MSSEAPELCKRSKCGAGGRLEEWHPTAFRNQAPSTRKAVDLQSTLILVHRNAVKTMVASSLLSGRVVVLSFL